MKLKKTFGFILKLCAFVLMVFSMPLAFNYNKTPVESAPKVQIVAASDTIYSVEYVLNGGYIEDLDYIQTFTEDTETTLLPRATKTGYKFDGWYLDQAFSLDKRTDRISQGTASDVTVYAKFTPINYFVTIEKVNGIDIEADMVSGLTMSTYNSAYNIVVTLNEGYKRSTSISLKINGLLDVAYYATIEDTYFFKIPVSVVNQGDFKVSIENLSIDVCEITMAYNGTTFTDTRLYNETYNLNDTMFTRNGYVQTGWKLNDIEYDFGDSFTVTSDLYFTPTWELEVYSIAYTLYDGKATNPSTYTILDEIVINNPERPGYNFVGWRGTGLNETTKVLVISAGSFGARTYEAIWRAITYTIDYNLNGGSIQNNIDTFTVVTPDIILVDPIKPGYDFIGWKQNGNFVTKVAKGTIGNVLVSAVWDIIEYPISYNLDGGTIENEPTYYTIIDSVNLVAPTKEGFVFGGWYDNNGFVGNTISKISAGSTGNASFYARWLKETLSNAVDTLDASITNPSGFELGVSANVALLQDKYEIYLCNSYIEVCDFEDKSIEYEIKQIFDINLLKNNAIYNDFTGTYTVKVKLQNPYHKTANAVVLVRNAVGGVDQLDATIEGEYLIFETEHFSRFVLVGKKVDTLVAMQWTVFVIVMILMLVSVIVTMGLVYVANKPKFEKFFKYIAKDFYKHTK